VELVEDGDAGSRGGVGVFVWGREGWRGENEAFPYCVGVSFLSHFFTTLFRLGLTGKQRFPRIVNTFLRWYIESEIMVENLWAIRDYMISALLFV